MQYLSKNNQPPHARTANANQAQNRDAKLNAFMIKSMLSVIFVAGCIFSAQHAWANEKAGMNDAKRTLIYISPSDYNHSVRLLHPYYDYWFEQGPIVEPIALAALQANDKNIAMCKANETADEVIRIKPSVFYNPLLRVFYTSVSATVFSGSGEQLAVYKGEGQQNGFMAVNHATVMHLTKAYKTAMDDLVKNMTTGKTADKKSAKTNAQVVAADAKTLPCGLIGQQAEPRFSFY